MQKMIRWGTILQGVSLPSARHGNDWTIGPGCTCRSPGKQTGKEMVDSRTGTV